MPQSCVNTSGASTFESKKVNEIIVNGLELRQVVVHDKDEYAMCVICGCLSDIMVVEADVVPFPEILVGDDAWVAAFGHAGRMDVNLTGVAILVGEAVYSETIPMNANVDAFDVDGGAEPCVAARDECITVGF
jgi:hypothetical protein